MKRLISIVTGGDKDADHPSAPQGTADQSPKIEVQPLELKITTFNTTECTTTISGVEVLIPTARVATNVPGGVEALNMSRIPKFEVIGLSGFSLNEQREALKGGDAYVNVLDFEVPGYPGYYNRVIQFQRPSMAGYHMPQDALSAIVTYPITSDGEPDGRTSTIGLVIADGNSNVEIHGSKVKQGFNVRSTTNDGYSLIEAPDSARYAQLLARNVPRLGSITQGAQSLNRAIQVVVEETDKPEYAQLYGGSTGQLLQIYGMGDQLYAVNINLGRDASMKGGVKPSTDFGGIGVLRASEPQQITLGGNLQDLSHEGKRRDFDPDWLDRTMDNYLPDDTVAIAMWSDGVIPNLAGFNSLIPTLAHADAEELVAAFARKDVFIPYIGDDKDDASFVLVIPATLPSVKPFQPLIIEEEQPAETPVLDEEPTVPVSNETGPAVNAEAIGAAQEFFKRYLTPEQIELFEAAKLGEIPPEQLLVELRNALKAPLTILPKGITLLKALEEKYPDLEVKAIDIAHMLETGKMPPNLRSLIRSS